MRAMSERPHEPGTTEDAATKSDASEHVEVELIDPGDKVAHVGGAPGAPGASGATGAQAGASEPGSTKESSEEESEAAELVEQPAKVMRIGSMVRQLLDEVRSAPLDEASRSRLREIYELSVSELAGSLSPDLAAELGRMTFPFGTDAPSEAELRIAQAQLVGWLEGLFHGIQASLLAQQMAARAQLDQMRQRGLPPGMVGERDGPPSRPGTYL